MKRTRSLLVNTLVLVCTLLVCAALFEMIGRAFLGGPIALWLTEGERDIQTDFDVTYSVMPNGARLVCDSTAAPTARRDVFFVGDSFTFGMGVEDLKDFVGLVSCEYPELRFHNFGSIGRGLNYYHMAIEDRMPGATKVLFITLFENDVVLDRNLFARDIKDWLYRRSLLASLLHHAKVKFQKSLRPYHRNSVAEAGPEARYNSPRSVFSSNPASLRPVVSLSEAEKLAFAARLGRLLGAALEKTPDLEIYMTLIPEATTVSEQHQRYYRSVGATVLPPLGKPSPAYQVASEVCGGHDACRFIDIFEEMRAAGAALYFPRDFHLNERGHRYLADKVSEILARFQVRP